MRWSIFCVFFAASFCSIAQSSIGGVVNSYATVSVVDYCTNELQLSSASGFFAGQKVLLIQMTGAKINTTNTGFFGDVTDYDGCGNYEVNEIQSISANSILLKYKIERYYDVAGKVQLVSIPEYSSAVIDSVLRPLAWNGNTGGVLVVKADTIILNANVTAKGLGFRGAQLSNQTTCWNGGNGGAFDYVSTTDETGARKGEGIGNTPAPFGRGKNANGGGGGNDHNTGGGGGSNYGKGGLGGQRTNASTFSCPGPSPGVGGAALDYNNAFNKIYMGGGGGAGDENNNEGTAGANGGGIVLLLADVLVGNSRTVNADADSVKIVANSDGAGAGGGGGTVLLYVNNISGNLNVTAKGGKGGNLDNSGLNNYCFGPGAGGGGGVLWVKNQTIPSGINFNAAGGVNGMNVWTLSTICPYGATNGAQPGDDGGTVTGLNVPFAQLPFVPLTASICCDTTVCSGAYVDFITTATASVPPAYQWSVGDTTASVLVQVNQSGVYQVTVSDRMYCEKVLSVSANVSNNPPDIFLCCDTVVCSGQVVSFSIVNTSGQQLSYQWSSGSTSNVFSETIFFSQSYDVTAINTSGCEVVKTVNAVVPQVSTSITASPDSTVLLGQPVQLFASGDSVWYYAWSPSPGLNSSTTQTPIAKPDVTTVYCVTATELNGCSASACHKVELVIPDVKVPDAFTPNSDGDNDFFVVFPLKYAKIFSIKIYNRWGELVFEAEDNSEWDGTYKGNQQPLGSYVCTVEYGSPLNPDKTKRITKDILLIR